MKRNVRVYIQDILDSIDLIEEKVAGMRDVLIHDYADINPKRIWKTIFSPSLRQNWSFLK